MSDADGAPQSLHVVDLDDDDDTGEGGHGEAGGPALRAAPIDIDAACSPIARAANGTPRPRQREKAALSARRARAYASAKSLGRHLPVMNPTVTVEAFDGGTSSDSDAAADDVSSAGAADRWAEPVIGPAGQAVGGTSSVQVHVIVAEDDDVGAVSPAACSAAEALSSVNGMNGSSVAAAAAPTSSERAPAPESGSSAGGREFGRGIQRSRRAGSSRRERAYESMRSVNEYIAENDVPGWDSKVGRFAVKWLFLRPPIPLLSVLVGVLLPLALCVKYIDDPPAFDISVQSFTVPNHKIALVEDGTSAAKENCEGDACLDILCPTDSNSTRRWRRESTSYGGAGGSGRRSRRVVGGDSIVVVYRSTSGNMLTAQGVETMRTIESVLARFAIEQGDTPTWTSLVPFIYPPSGMYLQSADGIELENVTAGLNVAVDGSGGLSGLSYPPPLGSRGLFAYGGGDFRRGDDGMWTSEYIRAEISGVDLGSASSQGAWVDKLEQVNPIPGAVDLMYASEELFTYQILEMLYEDVRYSVYALTFVAVVMLLHTRSVFLTVVAVVNILCAFALGYYAYREWSGEKNLSVLVAVSLFVVIGIAVDDVFVWTDMWRQQDRSVGLEDRMVRTLGTACRATLFTTVTSSCAFLSNALGSIKAVRDFGLFTGLVILSNYLLLLLVLPPSLAFWWKFVEPVERFLLRLCFSPFGSSVARERARKAAARKARASDARPLEADIQETSLSVVDDDASEPPSGGEALPPARKPPDYLLPPSFDDDDDGNDNDNGSGTVDDEGAMSGPVRSSPVCTHKGRKSKSVGLMSEGAEGDDTKSRSSGTLFQRFLYNIVGPLTVRGRHVILTASAVLFVAACVAAAGLEPADAPPSLVPASSNLGKVQKLVDVFSDWDATGGGSIAGSSGSSGSGDTVQVNPAGPATASPTAPTTSSAPTRAPTRAPTMPTAAPVSGPPTTSTPTTFASTMPPAGADASQSANVDLTVIVGLTSPWVDRSAADSTSFSEEIDKYVPFFSRDFNTEQPPPLVPDGVGTELRAEARAFCYELLLQSEYVLPDQDNMTICSAPAPYSGRKDVGCEGRSSDFVVMWFAFEVKGQFTASASSAEVMSLYRVAESSFDGFRSKYPTLTSVEQTCPEYEIAVYEEIAIWGAIWGICASLFLVFAAVTLFKAHGAVIAISSAVIALNVAVVVGSFKWRGWKLGGVEAVSLSILVGTCVDYIIHLMEGYLEASPGQQHELRRDQLRDLLQVQSDREVRFWRVRTALSEVGPPCSMSAITTAGAAFFLTQANIVILSRFGEILLLNTVVSIVLALTTLPALLAMAGPATYKPSIRRFLLGVLALVLLTSALALAVWLAAQSGSVRGPEGQTL